jgi:hypothetical protein
MTDTSPLKLVYRTHGVRDECFWCRRAAKGRPQRSRDHIIPAYNGGTARQDNIAITCRWCNTERGRITTYLAWRDRLIRDLARRNTRAEQVSLAKSVQKYHDKMPKMQALWRWWVARETACLGWSATALFPLTPIA